jgi:hypothetical protein
MKNTNKWFGIIALVAAIGFSMATLSLTGCDTGGDDGGGNNNNNNNNGNTTYSLDGVWASPSGTTQITVSGSSSTGTGVLSAYPSTTDPLMLSAIDKGYWKVGTTQY